MVFVEHGLKKTSNMYVGVKKTKDTLYQDIILHTKSDAKKILNNFFYEIKDRKTMFF